MILLLMIMKLKNLVKTMNSKKILIIQLFMNKLKKLVIILVQLILNFILNQKSIYMILKKN